MNYADRVQETTASVGTGSLALAGASSNLYRPFSPAIPTGAQVPYGVSDALGNWEIGYGTLTTATTLSRTTVLASSNAGALVNFPAGTKTVFLTLPAALLASLQVSQDIAFAAAVPLTVAGTQYMPQQTVASVIAFTVAAAPVKGASVYVRLIADGTNAPTFASMQEWGGSLGYDNRAGIPNQVQFFNDGYTTFYSISQAVGATAIDAVAPTASSSLVGNAAPTVVALTLSEAMDTGFTPAASAFTVGGHTVSSVAFASATVLNVTVSAAFVNGEAARTLAYTQPGANNLRDVAGNLLASFSGLAISNNVNPADTTAPTFASAQVANATPTVVQITMSETLAAITPATSAFAVSGGKTVSSVSIAGAVISLTCSAAYANGDTITVTYTKPGANMLQDAAGNQTATFGPSTVTNNVSGATTIRMTGPKSGDVTESGAAPWTYTSAGGATGTSGAMSTISIPGATNGEVVFKVNTTSNDFMLGISLLSTVNAYTDNGTESIWSNGGSVYKMFGNLGITSAAAPATGDLIRFKKLNSSNADFLIDYEWAVSKDNGATWTVVGTNTAGSNGLRKQPYYIFVRPGSNAVLSVVSQIGFA